NRQILIRLREPTVVLISLSFAIGTTQRETKKRERERERKGQEKNLFFVGEGGLFGSWESDHTIFPSLFYSSEIFWGTEREGNFPGKAEKPRKSLTFFDWVLVFLISGCSRFYFVLLFFFLGWWVGGRVSGV
ncbi:LOW QUALITY PROTEIN: hypothetical protein PanWU01x14_069060, partial [Parasponia andersonii]